MTLHKVLSGVPKLEKNQNDVVTKNNLKQSKSENNSLYFCKLILCLVNLAFKRF